MSALTPEDPEIDFTDVQARQATELSVEVHELLVARCGDPAVMLAALLRSAGGLAALCKPEGMSYTEQERQMLLNVTYYLRKAQRWADGTGVAR